MNAFRGKCQRPKDIPPNRRTSRNAYSCLGGLTLLTDWYPPQGEVGLFPFRVEWVFFASKRNAQAVTTLMGDTKVELGDGVTSSYGSELVVRSEDLEGAMNSMKQHAPIWNGVKADYPAWLWEAVPFLDSMGLKKYRPPVLNEEQHTNMLKHGTQDEITKAESMLEKLFRAFLRMISRSKDHPEAITLRMMIQAPRLP